jgi:DNA-directed RNA polymerase specialized sigma24 family protein
MKIFELVNKDSYYFSVCMKIVKNKDDAYDLMMNTALKIHEKKYTLEHARSLFYTIALREHINTTKNYDLIEELLVDKEVGKYQEDMIDCALTKLELSPKTKREFKTFSIFKLYLKHRNQQKVSDVTRISQQTVDYHIQKFKKYVIDNCEV